MNELEKARRWAYLWKQEAQIKRAATENLARMWREQYFEVERLKEYVVHKHNDCWQTGRCVCGLESTEPVEDAWEMYTELRDQDG